MIVFNPLRGNEDMYFPGDVVCGGILPMVGYCQWGDIAHGGIMSRGMLSMGGYWPGDNIQGDNIRWVLVWGDLVLVPGKPPSYAWYHFCIE